MIELASHGTLTEFLASPAGGRRPSVLIWVAREVAAGLAHMHANNIMHRDLKCDNVLMFETTEERVVDGQTTQVVSYIAKINDFGLATLKTVASSCCGTDGFLPPEVAARLKHDKTRDIFNYGRLLLEMITGVNAKHMPFLYVCARRAPCSKCNQAAAVRDVNKLSAWYLFLV